MPLILGTNSIKDTGYDVDNSLRFNGGSSDSLNRTLGTPTNNKKYTISTWVKKTKNSGNVNGNSQSLMGTIGGDDTYFEFNGSTDQLFFGEYSSSAWQIEIKTNRVFRDNSAWYHIVVAVDTTQGTEGNRVKLYVNGVQETSLAQTNYPSEDFNTKLNSASNHYISNNGNIGGDYAAYLEGYLSEYFFIDGLQLAPTSFGEFDDSGIWKPLDVSGLTFGDNGFYLEFKESGTSANASGLGADTSGNTNHFAVSNLTAVDQSTDTCTNNFATWNALFRKGTTTPAFTEGNLKSTFDDGGANEFALTTFGVSAGKWYAEVKWTSNTGTAATATGILDMDYSGTADPNNAVTNAFGYFGSGTKNVSGTASSYGDSYADGDIIGIAIDMDNNKLYFSKNGTFQNSGDPTTGSTGTGAIGIVAGVTYGIFATDYNNQVAELNTGSPAFAISSGNTDGNGYGNFEYAVPSGYYSLNTKNLAEYG